MRLFRSSFFGHDPRLVLAALWLAFALWPFIAPNDYLLSLGTTLLINIVLVASLDLLVGWTGLPSLAHGAFFGIGAYTSGILSTAQGWSPWFGTLAAVVAGALAAASIGVPTLRLRGHAFAMATLGFNAIVSTIFVGWVSMTGGPNGLIGVPAYAFGSLALDTPALFYPLAWVVSGIALFALFNLARSRPGRSLRAIASSEIAAACSGVPVFRYKLTVFMFASALAALAGALYVHQNNFASPDTFSFSTSVLLLVMVSVGGSGRRFGPVFGALVYTLLPELLHRFDDVEMLVVGIAMVVVVGFVPGGVSQGIGGLAARLRGHRIANAKEDSL